MKPKVIFFGSTADSVIVLKALNTLQLVCIVTQPPRPVGRKQILTPTPVAAWATEQKLPVLSFAADEEKSWMYQNEDQVIDSLAPFFPDVILSASYGQKIPTPVLKKAAFGGINIHPSLVPRWRGADPVPWTLH